MNYKAYVENPPEDMILRDHLAFDRTILANERTGLAYIRTVLVALATGLTIIKWFSDEFTVLMLGYMSLIIAGIITYVGLRSHFKFQQKIAVVYQPSQSTTPRKVPSESKEIELISQ